MLITILLSAIVSQITLPPLVVNGEEIPQRVVRLLMEEKPTPPPAPVEMPKPKVRAEKKPVEQPVQVAKAEPKVEELAPKEPEAKDQGILAFREKLAAAKDDQVVGRLGSQARIDNSDYNGGARAALDADDECTGLERRHQSRVDQSRHGRRPRQGRRHGRRASDAREQRNRRGRHAWRRSSGEPATSGSRAAPTKRSRSSSTATRPRSTGSTTRSCAAIRRLKGQVILKLTIEPDGSVSLCELKASDMNAPELTAQVVERVKGFDFGAKAVPAITILYPIDFLPAA